MDPRDVAIDGRDRSTPGDDLIYVVEGLPSNSRVQRLDGDGNFQLAWGGDVVRADAGGDLGGGFEVCRRAVWCKAGVAGGRAGELDRPSAVAVHPPSGDVLVLDAGNRRVQRYTSTGRPVGAWRVGRRGRGRFVGRSLVVAPSAPHHVLVADPARNMVVEHTIDGLFVRGWGWGVVDGSDRFQACAPRKACRAGLVPPGARRQAAAGGRVSWPGEVAIDAGGVVYASVFMGTVFTESFEPRTRIVRFETQPPADPVDASNNLLGDLARQHPNSRRPPRPDAITNGTTLGLDIDRHSGRLLAPNNPFGTSKVDLIEDPATPQRTRVHVADRLPFLQNITGIAATHQGEVVLLSSGRIRQPTGTSTYTGCPNPNANRDCHGLIALAPPQATQTLLTPALTGQLPGALIAPHGAVSYRLQATSNGLRWLSASARRNTIGTTYQPAHTPSTRLPHGRIEMLRVRVTKRTEQGNVVTYSNEIPALTDNSDL